MPSSKEITDSFILVGAVYNKKTVRVGCSESPQWMYRLAADVGADRTLKETNTQVIGKDFYVDADMEDYDKETEYDWLKEDFSIVEFTPTKEFLYRYADWWSHDWGAPDDFAITQNVAAIIYNECAHEMPSGHIELTVRKVRGFEEAMEDAGFSVEGFDGRYRLDKESSTDFRMYANSAAIYTR